MKISCHKDILFNSLNIAIKAVSIRSTLTILEYFLLKADEKGFNIIANDLEVGIEVFDIDANIIEEGAIAIEAKIFFEIIKKFDDDIVTISSDDANVAHISCGKSEFKLSGLAGDDFPYLPEIEKSNIYSIDAQKFKNMIRQTIFSVGLDQSKPSMTGVLFEYKDNYINMVTVDGFRVSHKKAQYFDDLEEFSVIIPPKALNEISKIISNNENFDINFYKTDKHILFEIENTIIVSRLIEGEFINYNEIFTSDSSTVLTVQNNLICSAIERASLISSRDNKKNPIKLEITDNNIIITSNTEFGNSRDELSIIVDGDPIEIAFNPKYLLDALKSIEEEEIVIELTTSLRPCIIKPKSNELIRYLILPLRIRV